MYPAFFLVALLVIAQATPTVTVSLDRGWYSPGESIVIHVSTTGFASSERLWLYVDKPDGHNLYFREVSPRGGTFVVTLPLDAANGTYTVTVTWDHRYIQTGFVVEGQPIPEFPFTPLVFIIAIAVAYATISWRKTSARSETLAPHP